jgi:hypothetical protein
MRQKAVVDSSILVTIISERNKELLRELGEGYEIYVPVNALEEAAYIILRWSFREGGFEGFYDFKEAFQKNELGAAELRLGVLNELAKTWSTLPINPLTFEIGKKLMLKYRLLPNDALVAAAAIEHGIGKLITRDSDFRRLGDLEVELI